MEQPLTASLGAAAVPGGYVCTLGESSEVLSHSPPQLDSKAALALPIITLPCSWLTRSGKQTGRQRLPAIGQMTHSTASEDLQSMVHGVEFQGPFRNHLQEASSLPSFIPWVGLFIPPLFLPNLSGGCFSFITQV